MRELRAFLIFLAVGFGLLAGSAARGQTDLRQQPLADLLALRTRIDDELGRRGVMRSANQLTGELAEYLFAKAFGWTLARNSQKSYDAVHDGLRYQIKARRDFGQSGARQLSAIRNPDGFDYLAVVIFDRYYRVEVAALIPAVFVVEEASYVAYTNSYRFVFRDDLLVQPTVVDVTERLRR